MILIDPEVERIRKELRRQEIEDMFDSVDTDGVGDVNSTARGSGARYNTGKTPFDLIPLSTLKDAADVFGYGKDKYAAWNWAKGMDWSIAYACMMRHMDAWYRGEENDPESGLPHLGHAMCNMIMLSHFAKYYKEGDDRPPPSMFQVATSATQKEFDTRESPKLPTVESVEGTFGYHDGSGEITWEPASPPQAPAPDFKEELRQRELMGRFDPKDTD